ALDRRQLEIEMVGVVPGVPNLRVPGSDSAVEIRSALCVADEEVRQLVSAARLAEVVDALNHLHACEGLLSDDCPSL
ncbi:hypothetical protein ACWTQZ_26575, partial [Escherichia coli]